MPAPPERGCFACSSEGVVAHLIGPPPEGAWTDPDGVVPTERCVTLRFRRGEWRRDWTVGNATFRAAELPNELRDELNAVTWSTQHGLVDGVLCDRVAPVRWSLRVVAQRECLAQITAPLPPLNPEFLGSRFRRGVRRRVDDVLSELGGTLPQILYQRVPERAAELETQVLDAVVEAFDDLDRLVVAWRILHEEADTLRRERLAHHLGVSVDLLRDREVAVPEKLRSALRVSLRSALSTS
jgi:hypothetical protein